MEKEPGARSQVAESPGHRAGTLGCDSAGPWEPEKSSEPGSTGETVKDRYQFAHLGHSPHTRCCQPEPGRGR